MLIRAVLASIVVLYIRDLPFWNTSVALSNHRRVQSVPASLCLSEVRLSSAVDYRADSKIP